MTKICKFLFAILVIIVMIDPTNTIFGVKEVAFAVFMLSCVICRIKIATPFLGIIGLLFLIAILSLLFGVCQGSEFDVEFTKSYFKTLLFLFVLLFVKKFDFLNKITVGAVFVSLITIAIAAIFICQMPFAQEMYEYISSRNHFIMINRERVFLGYSFMSFFYKTSPVLIIPFAFSLYRLLNSCQRWRNFFLTALFFTPLMLSGTRANMFSAVMVTLVMIIHRMYRSRFWRRSVPVLLICFLCGAIIVVKNLLSDQEMSLTAKSKHLDSIVRLFEEHPLFLLLGQGPGSVYYTTAVGEYVPQSELSYAEIIRMFGLPMGGVVIFFWFLPLIIADRRKNVLPEFFPFFISYLAYLCIGGTNPLLLSSTGIIVLATGYSFALKGTSMKYQLYHSTTEIK
jgi:hypothetical protein